LFVTRAINTRANLLDIGRVAEAAALDKYRFIRDAYLQRRRNLVFDGNPPREAQSGDAAEKLERAISSLDGQDGSGLGVGGSIGDPLADRDREEIDSEASSLNLENN